MNAATIKAPALVAPKAQHLTADQCVARYPLLVRSMKFAAVLCSGEAGCALRDWRDGFRQPWSGCEAVAHFGGPRAVIESAIRVRAIVRAMHERYSAERVA